MKIWLALGAIALGGCSGSGLPSSGRDLGSAADLAKGDLAQCAEQNPPAPCTPVAGGGHSNCCGPLSCMVLGDGGVCVLAGP